MQSLWSDIKAWFKNSETILWARFQTLSGFIVAAMAGIDWTQLVSMNFGSAFNIGQVALIGGGLVANGLFTEYLRRRGANL